MIPKKLKVCGHIVDVDVAFIKEDDTWGAVVPSELKMMLCNSMSESIQLQTAIHEILEFADRLFHIFDLNGDVSERQIQSVSAVIHQVLKDNPVFTKLFLKGR